MPTRNISLTPEQDAFIDEVLEKGEYRNASEAMRDAIRALQQRRAIDALKLERLRQSIDAGLADLDLPSPKPTGRREAPPDDRLRRFGFAQAGRGDDEAVDDAEIESTLDNLVAPARSAGRIFERILGPRQGELAALCRRYRVRRLELFGSAAAGEDRPDESDLDFLVEFETLPPATYADTYFGLMEALEELFGRPVDLVVASALRNPYFRASVERAKMLLYAA